MPARRLRPNPERRVVNVIAEVTGPRKANIRTPSGHNRVELIPGAKSGTPGYEQALRERAFVIKDRFPDRAADLYALARESEKARKDKKRNPPGQGGLF